MKLPCVAVLLFSLGSEVVGWRSPFLELFNTGSSANLASSLDKGGLSKAESSQSTGAAWPSGYAVANALGEEGGGAGHFTLRGESFELYSHPIELRYGEVHFRFQPTKRLPSDIIERFSGKHMAITGYEINVVRMNTNGEEESVPAYDAYNHHYSLTMMGSNKTDDTPAGVGSGGVEAPPVQGVMGGSWSAGDFPPGAGNEHGLDSHWISEGNGNEHRFSYHGYPEGHAQVIYSPNRIVNFFHLINTRGAGGRGGPGSNLLPRNSLAKSGARYSGLIECPCTTRRTIDVEAGTIDGKPVGFGCMGDLVAQNNTSCSLATYRGGLRCCEDRMVLLDADQEQPPEVDTFRFKMRFFFEEAAGVRNLVRLFWQTDLANGEYDVPSCSGKSQCMHVLKTDFAVNDMCRLYGCGDSYRPEVGLELMYVSGHLHVGGASLELWNADTGELICRVEPMYGSSDKALDEEGYIVGIPPCLFSDDDPRLPSPIRLYGWQRLVSVAKYHSDPGHHGVMAFWQMRARY